MVVRGSMDHGNLLEREVCMSELPSFQIRRFVSSVRSIDMFKSWPFRQKILEKSLNLGLKPLLPPFDLSPKEEEHLQNKHIGSIQDIPHDADTNAQCSYQNKIDIESTKGSSAVEQEAQSAVAEICSTTPDSTTSAAAYALPPILVSERSSDISNDNVGTCTINMTSDLLDSVRTQVDDKKGEPKLTFNPEIDHENDLSAKWHQEGLHDSLVDPIKEIDNIVELGEGSHEMLESSTKKYDASEQLNDTSVEEECNVLENNFETMTNCEDLSFTDLNLDALIQQVCPVCLSFTSTSNTTLNAHIDHCLESVLPSEEGEAKPCKSRMKPRKMRSMIEICAEAPSRTLEDLERCSEQWDLDGKISNDDDHSSYVVRSDGHASVRRCSVLKARQPGKSRSMHNHSACKQKGASADLNIMKQSRNALQGNMQSSHAFDPDSEEQCHEQKRLHFADSKLLEFPPKNSKKQPVNKSGLQERNVQGDGEDDDCAPDEMDDLEWSRRLDATVVDTSADEEKQLRKKLKFYTRASDSNASLLEESVNIGEKLCQRRFGSGKVSPAWITVNRKYQTKRLSSENKQVDGNIKKRKLKERHVDWIGNNDSSMAGGVPLDMQADKSQRNKSTPKRKSVATVGASASHDEVVPLDKDKDCGSARMKTFPDGSKDNVFDRDACLMQAGNGTQFSSLKYKSSEIQKAAKGTNQAKNKRRSLHKDDSFRLSDPNKAHETMPIALEAGDEHGIASTSSVFSENENVSVGHDSNNVAEKQQISSQDNAYQQVGKKPSRDEQNVVHASQEKQIPDSDRLRIVQTRAENCISAHKSLRNQSLNDESCSSLVDLVKERCNAGPLWSQEVFVTAPGTAVETHVSCDNGRFFYTNEPSAKQPGPTSDRTLIPEIMPCSQSNDFSMTRGYVSNLGGSNPVVGTTKQNVLLGLKPDIAPARVSMNVSSQRLVTPEISILEAGCSERFSGNAFTEQLSSNYGVNNGEHIRNDPYNLAWANRNQQPYQKDIGILQTKHHVGCGELQKQSQNVFKDGIGKGFQDSADIGICNGIGHEPHINSASRILTSDTISMSEPTRRFVNNQVNQLERDGCVPVSTMKKGRMTNLLDDLTRSMDGKSTRSQNPVPTRYYLQPMTESFSQHVHRDLHAVFPSESATCRITNGQTVHPQFLQFMSQAEKERHPALVTEYVNSTETIESYKGQCAPSTPHMSRGITFARMNGTTGISEESLKSYNAVDYSGEQGVVHIFGNPVFKLMGRNVMVANNNIKPLAVENTIDQSGGHRFYPPSSLNCLQESRSQRYYPPEIFPACFHGDSSRLGNHSFMLENTTIHAGDLQRASSSKFSQFSPTIYKDNVISTCHIQVEKEPSLHSVPEVHFKQQPTLLNNTRKQVAESCTIEDCLSKGGNNCLLKSPNTMLVHNESQIKAHSQAFHSSLSSHMQRGASVNGYRQQSGTLADIVQSSERNSHRSVGCCFAGRNF